MNDVAWQESGWYFLDKASPAVLSLPFSIRFENQILAALA
jgi:hypothetical protein